jgi:hypothetical protein
MNEPLSDLAPVSLNQERSRICEVPFNSHCFFDASFPLNVSLMPFHASKLGDVVDNGGASMVMSWELNKRLRRSIARIGCR